jgi:hypothetical protein
MGIKPAVFTISIMSIIAFNVAAHGATVEETGYINITTAKNVVKERLRDPDSAQFRNVGAYRGDPKIKYPMFVCGEVNAKNGFGGYDGYEPFVWVADIIVDGRIRVDLSHGMVFLGNKEIRAHKMFDECKLGVVSVP